MKKSQVVITRTSYSALETFRQCPQKFEFQYIDRIKAPKSKEAIFGNKVHETLRFFHSKYPVSPTLDELLNYFKDNWNSECFKNQEEDIIYFSEGIKMLKNYYQYYLKNRNNFTVLDTEARFEIPLKNPETNQECVLSGKIDRIDKLGSGTIEVIDYKTTKKLPSQVEADKDLQFSIYCLAVFNRWPNLAVKDYEDIKLSFHYLKHGEVLSTKRTKAQLENAKEEVWQRIYGIEQEKFKPIPSALCDWCGYKKICPMWKSLYKEQITIDDEQAKKVVDEYFQLKEQNSQNNKKLNQLQEIIEAYLNKEKIERVFGNSGYITRLAQIRKGGYDIKKLEQIIKTIPLDIRQKLEKAKKIDKEYKILKISHKKEAKPLDK